MATESEHVVIPRNAPLTLSVFLYYLRLTRILALPLFVAFGESGDTGMYARIKRKRLLKQDTPLMMQMFANE